MGEEGPADKTFFTCSKCRNAKLQICQWQCTVRPTSIIYEMSPAGLSACLRRHPTVEPPQSLAVAVGPSGLLCSRPGPRRIALGETKGCCA